MIHGILSRALFYSGARNPSDSLQPPWFVDTHWRIIGCLIVLERLQQEIVHIFRLADLHYAKLLVSLWCDDSLRKPVGKEHSLCESYHVSDTRAETTSAAVWWVNEQGGEADDPFLLVPSHGGPHWVWMINPKNTLWIEKIIFFLIDESVVFTVSRFIMKSKSQRMCLDILLRTISEIKVSGMLSKYNTCCLRNSFKPVHLEFWWSH